VTPLPIGFAADDSAPNTFSEWVADRNDPYMRGWAVTNLGTKNDGLRGDVIISWLKPLDAAHDDPNDVDDQLYFMVVNGLTGPDGTAADYRQRITVNFLGTAGPAIQRLNPDTGEVEFVNLELIPGSGGRRRLVLELDGGMGELFKFNTSHSFLGVEPYAVPGDFNRDGAVDAADYTSWRDSLGSRYHPDHYNLWKTNFGATLPGGNAALDSAETYHAVAEPSRSWIIALAGILLLSVVARAGTGDLFGRG
jgi:hypothetical protein